MAIIPITSKAKLIKPCAGYIIKASNRATILCAGDTILTEELKQEIIENKADIIITRWGEAQLSVDDKGNKTTLLLNAEDTIDISPLTPNGKIVAVLLEALEHCPITRGETMEKAKSSNIYNIIIPKDGEKLIF